MKIRRMAVSGSFYPADAAQLKEFFDNCGRLNSSKNAFAAIVPHAGYVYSGALAFKTLSALPVREKSSVVLLGPNHTGLGTSCSLSDFDAWETPLGSVKCDLKVFERIAACKGVSVDNMAHLQEHSIEVQLPMLRYFYDAVEINCCVVMAGRRLEYYKSLGYELAEKLNGLDVLFVVSSDMNHYESHSNTVKKDALAIEALEGLDYRRLYEVVLKENVTMCGVFPAIVLLAMFEAMGRDVRFKQVGYHTSGEVFGDYDAVVGYLGGVFELCD